MKPRHVIVRGETGSGKSTLLNKIVNLTVADRQNIGLNHNKLVIYIKLDTILKSKKGAKMLFGNFSGRDLLYQWVNDKGGKGTLIVIDDLGTLSEDIKKRLFDIIISFKKAFVVTSSNDEMPAENFKTDKVIELEPLTDELKNKLISSFSKNNIRGCGRIQNLMVENLYVCNLCGNPMLLKCVVDVMIKDELATVETLTELLVLHITNLSDVELSLQEIMDQSFKTKCLKKLIFSISPELQNSSLNVLLNGKEKVMFVHDYFLDLFAAFFICHTAFEGFKEYLETYFMNDDWHVTKTFVCGLLLNSKVRKKVDDTIWSIPDVAKKVNILKDKLLVLTNCSEIDCKESMQVLFESNCKLSEELCIKNMELHSLEDKDIFCLAKLVCIFKKVKAITFTGDSDSTENNFAKKQADLLYSKLKSVSQVGAVL